MIFRLATIYNSNSKFKKTLLSLGMFTHTYESQDIIQIAFKNYREGGSAVKKVCQIYML
jgi:hypothetical protein